MNNAAIAISELKWKLIQYEEATKAIHSAIAALGGEHKRKRSTSKAKAAPVAKKVDYAARVAKRQATMAAKKMKGASLAEVAAD